MSEIKRIMRAGVKRQVTKRKGTVSLMEMVWQ